MNRLVRRTMSSVPSKVPTAPVGIYEADVINGVPTEVSNRTVRIYRPGKTAMQSGIANTEKWQIDFDTQKRWSNDLMGWSSSADTVQALRLKFDSKEDAIVFAERHGYDYRVEDPKETKFKVKNYVNNFKYNPKKLTWFHTK